MTPSEIARRQFVRFVLSSPLWAPFSTMAFARDGRPEGLRYVQDEVITAPDRAINVFDFEAAARKALPPAHFGYMATGVDDDATVRANREGFARFQIRVRRLIDVREIDMSVSIFGTKWPTPIVIAPVGSQRAFHAEGEVATARAAKAKQHLQILSTVASTGVEDVIAARGAPVWYQLYPTDQWSLTTSLVKRAAAAGCPALALTVDLQGGSNRETLARAERIDTRKCEQCHTGGARSRTSAYLARKPMFKDLDVSQAQSLQSFAMNWDLVKRLRDLSSMKLLIKGIVTREDAEMAVQHGVDAVIVSNHGGRGEESGRATIESLVEVVEGAKGRIPVIVDGGFRRGTDIFKALALGATAVMIGRPYIWGLGAFGQPGVEAVLDILTRELRTIMRQAGTVRIADITRAHVVDTRGWRAQL